MNASPQEMVAAKSHQSLNEWAGQAEKSTLDFECRDLEQTVFEVWHRASTCTIHNLLARRQATFEYYFVLMP